MRENSEPPQDLSLENEVIVGSSPMVGSPSSPRTPVRCSLGRSEENHTPKQETRTPEQGVTPSLPRFSRIAAPVADHYGLSIRRKKYIYNDTRSTRSRNPEASPQNNMPDTEVDGREDDLCHQLRVTREDAVFNLHLETAEYAARELVMLSNCPDDSFRLAQIYFMTGSPRQALHVLGSYQLLSSPKCRVFEARCHLALGNPEKALNAIGEKQRDSSINCSEDVKTEIKVAAVESFLRGKIFCDAFKFDHSKTCFLAALNFDGRCFEALNALIKNNMLTPSDEENILASLKQQNLDYLSISYKLKMRPSLTEEAEMNKIFRGSSHWDAILWKARCSYAKGHVVECFDTLTQLLEEDPANRDCLPLYINVLGELGLTQNLIQLAKDMKEWCPGENLSLFADAAVEQAEGRTDLARSKFWNICQNFPNFAPAWIAYGHLCVGSESLIKATRAYSIASRLTPSEPGPFIFLGQRHREFSSTLVAEAFLERAQKLIDHPDPVICNELGMIKYHEKEFRSAINYFKTGLGCVNEQVTSTFCVGRKVTLKEALWINLGHSLRRHGVLDSARICFENAFELNSLSGPALAGLGMLAHSLNQVDDCIDYYHRSLLSDPHSHVVKSLLEDAFTQRKPSSPQVNCALTKSDVPPLLARFGTRKRRREEVPYSVTLGLRSKTEDTNQNILSDDDTPTSKRQFLSHNSDVSS